MLPHPKLNKKSLAVGIVLLFVGTCLLPVISGNNEIISASKHSRKSSADLRSIFDHDFDTQGYSSSSVTKNEQRSLGPLGTSGYIVSWGSNNYGQCAVPSPNRGFSAVSAGYFHSLGLKATGSVVAWGYNNYGQCNVPSPNSGFIAVAGGFNHSLGLKATGSVVAWGNNNYGQLTVPSPNSGFIAISAGIYHSLGLKATGSVVAWGNNVYRQCNVPSPNSGFVAVSAGYIHSLGLKANGSVIAWGDNDYGQCNVSSPNSGFIAIAAGGQHSLGLKANGSIVAWGYNNYGQCTVPIPNSDFVAVAAGGFYSLGLKADGSIVAWGRNDWGQCNVPAPNSGFIAITAGRDHSLGLKNYRPVLGLPSPANGSTGNPLRFNWSIPINDPEGDLFSWTIQCDNGLANSGMNATNGTKILTFSGLLKPSKIYKVWVNVTDTNGSGLYTRTWYTFVTIAKNPSVPKITGPTKAKRLVPTRYNFTSTSPEGNYISYFIDWGDNTKRSYGPFYSGEKITKSHTWIKKGSFAVRAKAKDITGSESNWSEPLQVTMPLSYEPPYVRFFAWLFNRFPHAFPILRQMLGY